MDTIKPNEDKVFAKRIDKEEYAKEAESAYQQIVDLTDRFQQIDAAIVASKWTTYLVNALSDAGMAKKPLWKHYATWTYSFGWELQYEQQRIQGRI